MADEKFHYYAATAFTWVTDDDLWKALNTLKKKGGPSGIAKKGDPYIVFKVPGTNADSKYQISNWVPQVEGIECIAEGKF